MFTTIGILGTFGGIAYGLWFFNPEDIEKSIPTLMKGLKTAFFAILLVLHFQLYFQREYRLLKTKMKKVF
jgi:hypothetical protein